MCVLAPVHRCMPTILLFRRGSLPHPQSFLKHTVSATHLSHALPQEVTAPVGRRCCSINQVLKSCQPSKTRTFSSCVLTILMSRPGSPSLEIPQERVARVGEKRFARGGGGFEPLSLTPPPLQGSKVGRPKK